MSRLQLASMSRAQDASYLAMVDLAHVAAAFGDEYRIIGGHMVTLLVAVSGATLYEHFGRPNGAGLRALTRDKGLRARVQALVNHTIERPHS